MRPEQFVVGSITRFGCPKKRHDNAGNLAASNAAGGLNVLGCGLGLAIHEHDCQSRNIDPDGEHVRRGDNVNCVPRSNPCFQSRQFARQIVRGNATCQLHESVTAQRARSITWMATGLQESAYVIPNERHCAAEFAEAIVVRDHGPVGVTIRR